MYDGEMPTKKPVPAAKKSAPKALANATSAPAGLLPVKQLSSHSRTHADQVTGADHEIVVQVAGQPSSAVIKKVAALPNLQFILAPELETFPKEWCSLSRLQSLYLAGAPLKTLPEEIRGLVQLRSLDLGSCKHLTALPDALGELTNLASLDVRFSSLTALPKSLGNVKTLAIHGTDITPAAAKKAAPKARVQK
jgi:Leucine-rich repeat (LRR) protein